jgi:hypothetical protein
MSEEEYIEMKKSIEVSKQQMTPYEAISFLEVTKSCLVTTLFTKPDENVAKTICALEMAIEYLAKGEAK